MAPSCPRCHRVCDPHSFEGRMGNRINTHRCFWCRIRVSADGVHIPWPTPWPIPAHYRMTWQRLASCSVHGEGQWLVKFWGCAHTQIVTRATEPKRAQCISCVRGGCFE